MLCHADAPEDLLTQERNPRIYRMRCAPAYAKLTAWLGMPSLIVLLEMTLRHQTSDLGDGSVICVIDHAIIHLSQQLTNNPNNCSSSKYISCVASIHKLLLIHTSAVQQALHPNIMTRVCQTLTLVTQAHMKLETLLADIQHIMSRGCSSNLCGSSDRGKTATCIGPFQQGTQQLRAVMVMVLVWLGNLWRRLMSQQGGGGVPTEEEVLGWVREVGVHDAKLARVARVLSLPLRSELWGTCVTGVKQEAIMWDEYALKHFHGRLLPGCSYLGCTNMSGTSEEALETLLCSGCKRTRYCGVMCQRAAWVMGGHSVVCGKGK